MGMPENPVYVQNGNRWRDNVPDPSGVNTAFDGGDAAAQATVSDYPVDTLIRGRIVIQQTSAIYTSQPTDGQTEFIVQFDTNGNDTWVDVGAVGADAVAIDFISASGFADGDDTTQLVGGGSFDTGDSMETNVKSDTITFTENQTSETELEIAIVMNSGQVSDEDSFRLRVLYSLADADPPATPLSSYTNYLTITADVADDNSSSSSKNSSSSSLNSSSSSLNSSSSSLNSSSSSLNSSSSSESSSSSGGFNLPTVLEGYMLTGGIQTLSGGM